MPRLHPSARSQQAAAAPLPAFSPAYTDRLAYQSQHISHVPQPPLAPASSDIASRSSQQNQNAQYIFYTGHGNYQRKSFDTNDPSTNLSPQLQPPPPPPAPPNYNDPINAFLGQPQNYNNNNNNTNSFVNSRQSSQPQRTSNYHSNGPYINSNIPDAPPNNNNNNVYNDFRFPSYR